MTYISSMDADMFVELIDKAIEEDINERLWEKWLHEQTDMNFDEYKERHKPRPRKSDEEVLQDAENILKMMSKPN